MTEPGALGHLNELGTPHMCNVLAQVGVTKEQVAATLAAQCALVVIRGGEPGGGGGRRCHEGVGHGRADSESGVMRAVGVCAPDARAVRPSAHVPLRDVGVGSKANAGVALGVLYA